MLSARFEIATRSAAAVEFYARQQVQSSSVQFDFHRSAQGRDVLREMRLSALRDRIRVIPRDELDRDVNRQ